MNIYQNTEDNSFNHSCNISGTQLLTKENLKQHHDKVPKNQETKCIKCDHRVRSRSSLMKRLSTLSCNVTIRQLQRGILLNTKGQYMKELDTLAVIAVNIFLRKEVLRNIKEQYIKE